MAKKRGIFKILRIIPSIFMLIYFYAVGFAQENSSGTNYPTNLLLMQNSVVKIIDSIISINKTLMVSTCSVTTDGFEYGWIPKQAITGYLIGKGIHVYDTIQDSSYFLKINSFHPSVYYGDAIGGNIFGASKTVREVSVELSLTIKNNFTNEIFVNSLFKSSLKDTIDISSIEDVENKSIPLTQAPPPQRSFLNRYAEPFLILGATGVAVFLFYNVRTK
ncbi:MAG: hypothetical protein HY964_00315 [Ignavibacteriales bacterium]|nr:hypothetical protein [Ignavibacteriales bacterium]